MSDEDISLSEKRVYADASDTTTAFVGTEHGVVRVSVSDDIVGEFSLEWGEPVTDIAAADGRLAVATPDDVFVRADEGFHETGFGPASAVGYAENGDFLAAGAGRIARFESEWTDLGMVDAVRAISGSLIAAESGIHQFDGTHVGLTNARDVSSVGTPLAATATGLYYLANGWVRALEGDFSVVTSDGSATYAATSGTVYKQDGNEREWTSLDLPVEGLIKDIVSAEHAYAITDEGTFLVNAGDGWRYRSIGMSGVTGLAVL